MPGANEENNAREDIAFEIPGLESLSMNLVGGATTSTTPSRLLDKDLELYDKKAHFYCQKVMKDAARKDAMDASSNVSGDETNIKTTITPKDPVLFWNVQVSLLFLVLILISDRFHYQKDLEP